MKRYSLRLVIAAIVLFSAIPAFAKGQDIVRMNQDVEITKSMVVNDVVVIGGSATISGTVDNNVVAKGGSVTLKPGCLVKENVVIVGGELVKDPAAEVHGKISQIYMPHFIPSISTFFKGNWMTLWVTLSLLALLGFLGLAILLNALIPGHMAAAVKALEHSFIAMLLWGILWIILIVPVAVLLAVSIVGIILIPLEILLVVLAMIIGYIAAGILIGKKVLSSFTKKRLPFIDAILGILLLSVIGFVPVVGPIVKMLFLIAGFGAVLTTRFGTIR